MTISDFNGPACREVRQLLGVYVVGAIDPAERAIVDDHLGHCQLCRDELAGLAGLPAMLSRVPAADVEWLDMTAAELPEMQEPSELLLASLLRKVSVKRRHRMWRGAAAVAAAAVIAAGGTAVATQLTRPSGQVQTASEVATAVSPDGVAAVVDYAPAAWGGTDMRVQVSGIRSGTICKFWVVGKDGRPLYAGSWTVRGGNGSGYGQAWYKASSAMAPGSVHNFRITAPGKGVLLNIPAT
jgi:hypothetical protein